VIPSRQHSLNKTKVLRAQDLTNQKLVIYHREDYPGYWARLQAWIKAEKINLRVASRCDGITSLFNAVEAGIGIALVLERSIQLKPGKIAVRALRNGPGPVHIAAGVRSDQEAPAHARAFLKALQNAGAHSVAG
jgi:DNA-binding transcriptional LysR family regulator